MSKCREANGKDNIDLEGVIDVEGTINIDSMGLVLLDFLTIIGHPLLWLYLVSVYSLVRHLLAIA